MVKYSDYYIKTTKEERNNDFAYYFDKITTAIFPNSKPVEIKEPKKILVIRNDHLGDLILSTQVFREIKKKYPKAHVTALIDPKTRPVIEKNKNVDEIIEMGLFWRKKKIKPFFEYLKVLKKLRREKFDVGVDVRGSLYNMFFYLYLPKVKRRVAYFNKSGGKVFLTDPVLFSKRESWRYTIIGIVNKALNMNSKDFWPEIVTDKGDEKIADDFLKKNKINKYVCLIPGITTSSKGWPIEKFKQLIIKFNKKYPKHKVLLVGGKKEEEIINCITKESKNGVPVIDLNLRAVSLIFKKADAIVACDGGLKAVAWIVHGNLIYLAGPVDQELHPASFDKNTKVVMHKLPCYPCNWSKPCEMPHGKWCMDLISVEEVMKEIEKFIKKSGKDKKRGKDKKKVKEKIKE